MVPGVYGPHQDILVRGAGVALMRNTDGVWYFEGWVNGGMTFRELGGGYHVFQLWLVNGYKSNFERALINGNSSLAALIVKK